MGRPQLSLIKCWGGGGWCWSCGGLSDFTFRSGELVINWTSLIVFGFWLEDGYAGGRGCWVDLVLFYSLERGQGFCFCFC